MPGKCISITKVQIGHIVGPKGATIKSIQEETGAKVEILDDGPQVKITADEQAQVDAAEEAIKKIIANQENPDYEGPEGARLRKEANELGDKRGQLFDQATEKRNAGDHDGANQLATEAKQAGEDMAARHREAAAAIAKYNNEDKGKGEEYFDMHGLREEEAMDMLEARTAVLEGKSAGTITEFEVIPGAGHHSAPGAQKLMGATETFFKTKSYEYESASAGSIVVKVPGGGETVVADAVREEEAEDEQAADEEPDTKVFVAMPEEVRERRGKSERDRSVPAAGGDVAPSSRVFVRMPADVRERRSRSREDRSGRPSAVPAGVAAAQAKEEETAPRAAEPVEAENEEDAAAAAAEGEENAAPQEDAAAQEGATAVAEEAAKADKSPSELDTPKDAAAAAAEDAEDAEKSSAKAGTSAEDKTGEEEAAAAAAGSDADGTVEDAAEKEAVSPAASLGAIDKSDSEKDDDKPAAAAAAKAAKDDKKDDKKKKDKGGCCATM